MSLVYVDTNAFGCEFSFDLVRFVVWNKLQGYTNMGCGFFLLLFIIVFIIFTIKLFKIPFTTFSKVMISLNIIILVTLGLSVYSYFDFSLYCVNGIKIEFTYPVCAILPIVAIFFFDYIICSALKAPLEDEKKIQEELVKKIFEIFIIRIPFLGIYILLMIV